jgi:hypothetical protein
MNRVLQVSILRQGKAQRQKTYSPSTRSKIASTFPNCRM